MGDFFRWKPRWKWYPRDCKKFTFFELALWNFFQKMFWGLWSKRWITQRNQFGAKIDASHTISYLNCLNRFQIGRFGKGLLQIRKENFHRTTITSEARIFWQRITRTSHMRSTQWTYSANPGPVKTKLDRFSSFFFLFHRLDWAGQFRIKVFTDVLVLQHPSVSPDTLCSCR